MIQSVQHLINLSSRETQLINQLSNFPDSPIQDGFSAAPITKEAELKLVGGRLYSYSSSWPSSLQQSLSPWLINLIQHGYHVPLVSSLLLVSSILHHQLNHSQSEINVIDNETQTLLQRQVIEAASLGSAGFHSQLFIIPKKYEGLRPVLNLRHLNSYLPQQRFKIEIMSTITCLLQPHNFLTSIDLQDAFHHIFIHPSSWPVLRFRWKQQTYQYRALPFGLSLSSVIFTKALMPLLRWVRRKKIRLSAYRDNLIIMAKSKQESPRHTE